MDENDQEDELFEYKYITEEEVKEAIETKHYVDQLYLVKWKSLSYTGCTWEPMSCFIDYYEERVNEYMKFNRSLD